MKHTTLLVILSFTACATTDLKRIDDASLTAISPEQKSSIEQRARAHEEAEIQLKMARQALAEAELSAEEASKAQDRAEERMDDNDDLQEQASDLGLSAKARDFASQTSGLRLRFNEAKLRADLEQARKDHASAQVKLRTAELALADASWEEAKASALVARAAPGTLNLSDFTSQVAEAHEAVASAQERAAEAWGEVEAQRQRHEAAVAQVPQITEDERRAVIAERDRQQLAVQVQRLEKRVRDLERENAGLVTRGTEIMQTSTERPSEAP